ncbi:erythromycin esterase family protein [Aquibacillus rhizosphaerae]|uniref:Erythromycin esterase family protein n=1 Tax=Aquibacillus rhizosphaerae TaxID=3051431 RepID=A0ABT7LB61_9BACI|nr:erythromycin esterase family protein [Aquibacillus sp. LR5S19]MDL4841795.1 erythromycin esterase family protein [Aquibacillus sp. LR5S19]
MDINKAIQESAKPFQTIKDLTPLINRIGDAKIVLLGESSHGTSEFYSIRAELSKRLIEEKGFSIVAVEGDWPASQAVNRYIKGNSNKINAKETLKAFKRWPTWMWANEEMVEFIDWLKAYNQYKDTRVGFYGIDVYSLWESIDEIIKYLKKTEPLGADLELAKKAFACFEPFNRQEDQYAISSSFFSEDCVEEVAKLLASIRSNQKLYSDDLESDLNLKMNALVAKNAEEYYRTMVKSDVDSWNTRDNHMVETLNEIRNYHGENSKVIVWEHNTHVGDASATDMKSEGMVNVGQLVREHNEKKDVYIVGFGTHQGTVIAADKWGVNLEQMIVPPAEVGSWEDVMHQAGAFNKFILFDDQNRNYFNQVIGHRAIGVVYNPVYESYGNYVPSIISKRYDAFIHVDRSMALRPLEQIEAYL